jgi:hypothetical protein
MEAPDDDLADGTTDITTVFGRSLNNHEYQSVEAWLRDESVNDHEDALCLWGSEVFLNDAPTSCVQALIEVYPEDVHPPRKCALHRALDNWGSPGTRDRERDNAVLKLLIQAAPQACRIVDMQTGEYPLHYVCRLLFRWLDDEAFAVLVEAFPEAAEKFNTFIFGHKMLPLHLACAVGGLSKNQFRRLFLSYPEAAHIQGLGKLSPIELVISHRHYYETTRGYVAVLTESDPTVATRPLPATKLIPFMYAARKRQISLTFDLLLMFVAQHNLSTLRR